MKCLPQESHTFEIQNKNDDPVIYMDDDEDAPIIIRVLEPKEILKMFSVVALINFRSDMEIICDNQKWKIERLVFVYIALILLEIILTSLADL